MLASSRRVSADTPAVFAAASKRATAALAALAFSSRWTSIRSVGMPPSRLPGITGS